MTGWQITNTYGGSLREAGDIIAVLDADNKTINPDEVMYWIAPSEYLGNKVSWTDNNITILIYYQFGVINVFYGCMIM